MDYGLFNLLLFVQDMKWSALFYAYKNGHWNTVRLLLEYGANPDLRDKVCIQTTVEPLLGSSNKVSGFRGNFSVHLSIIGVSLNHLFAVSFPGYNYI